jgi:hypothetical protein
LTANISIAGGAATGARTVAATTGAQVASIVNGFTITQGPAILSIVPNSGQQSQASLGVVISGLLTHFTNSSVVDLGQGITVGSVTAANATTLNASLSISAGAALGLRNLTVTSGTEVVTLLNAFTVAPTAGTVTGTVFLTGGVTPAANANVQVFRGNPLTLAGSATADGSGQYSISGIPGGDYRVYATNAANTQIGSAAGTISTPNQTVTSNITLTGSGRVEVTVRDIRNALVAGAGVEVTMASFPIPASLLTVARRSGNADAAGFIAFDGFPAGQVSVIASAAGGATGNAEGNLSNTGTLQLTVYLGVGEVFTPLISMYDGEPLSNTLPPGRNESASVVVSMYNGDPLGNTLPPGRNESASLIVSMYNGEPLGNTLPLGRNESASVMVSMYNGDPLSISLPAGLNEANSLLISMGNGPSFVSGSTPALLSFAEPGKGPADEMARAAGSEGVLGLTLQAIDRDLISGETIPLTAEPLGGIPERVLFHVNGVRMAAVDQAPFITLFTVPAGIDRVEFHASAELRGGDVSSSPVTLRVQPDRMLTLRGRAVGPDGSPVAGAKVRIAYHGLRAEYFDYDTPLTQIPDLTRRAPTRRATVTALNTNNPFAVFGPDPLGLGMRPDFAARYRGWFLAPGAGQYRFALRAQTGARLLLAGQVVAEAREGESESSITLAAGPVAIEVQHFDNLGAADLQLFVTPPNGPRQLAPPQAFWSEDDALSAVTGDQGEFEISGVPLSLGRIRVLAEEISRGLTGFSAEVELRDSVPTEPLQGVSVPLAPRR